MSVRRALRDPPCRPEPHPLALGGTTEETAPTVALRPIKLHLDGEEIHLVPSRDLERWGGFINGPRAAYTLVTPDNVAEIRQALLVPGWVDTEGVFTELRKQLEDGMTLFFEVPPEPVRWDAPEVIDIHDLLPQGGDDNSLEPERPSPQPELHWIEVVCISAKGGLFAGARARARLPDGRSESVTLDGRGSVRFDEITEGGTVHFELSGDAAPHGAGSVPVGQRYELGAPIGLVTRKRHVLIVHPNPEAFVSVAVLMDDEPVAVGRYTLTTANGEKTGSLGPEVVREDGFVLPSPSSFGFEGVILAPRSDVPTSPTWITIEALHASDDAPVVGRSVRLEFPSGAEQTRQTGEDGRATFEGLQPGDLFAAHVLASPSAQDAEKTDLDEVEGLEGKPDEDEAEESSEEPAPQEEFEIAEDEDIAPPPSDSPPPDFEELGEAADAEEVDDDDLEDERDDG